MAWTIRMCMKQVMDMWRIGHMDVDVAVTRCVDGGVCVYVRVYVGVCGWVNGWVGWWAGDRRV